MLVVCTTGYAQEPGTTPSSELDSNRLSELENRIGELESLLDKQARGEKRIAEEKAKKPIVTPRGRIHTDANWFHQSDANRAAIGDLQDGVFVRRARLGFDAAAFGVTEYRLDFEMGAGRDRLVLVDAYGRLTNIPWLGNIQMGHMREPFSLDNLTSSNWATFMERSLINAFDPNRNWGLMMFNCNEAENFTFAMGVFREGTDQFGDDIGDSGERALTTRSTWMPYQDTEQNHFIEVGGSYSYRNLDKQFPSGIGGPEQSILRFQGRPEIALAEENVGGVPSIIAVEFNDASNAQLFGVETSWNFGSLNLQSEFNGASVHRGTLPSAFYHGTYAQASYFLTGESRLWNNRAGTFARTNVHNPIKLGYKDRGSLAGSGAWEVAVRWSYLDFTDAVQDAGYLDTLTTGLNWYLNPFVRLMFNYTHADVHLPTHGRSDLGIFHTRLDVNF